MNDKYMDFYTKQEIDDMFGGMKLKKISQADYDALIIKDPDTIYYVYGEDGNVTQYVGTAQMGGGSAPVTATLSARATGASVIGDAELNQTIINLSSADFEQGDISDGVPYPSGRYIRSAEFINLPADADSTKLSITLTPASSTRYWVCGYDSTGTWVRTSSSTNNNQMCTLSLSGISKIKLVIGYTQSYNLSPSGLVSATLTIL